MKKILLLILLLCSIKFNAQHKHCGADEKLQEKFIADPKFKVNHDALEISLYGNNYLNKQAIFVSPNIVVTIPVVVHVIYKADSQNISDAQINSQIAILNDDYRKLNADFSSVVPSVFQSLGADFELEFVLAKRTIDNQQTNGIERKMVDASFDFDTQYFTETGLTAWAPTKYLNMWVGRFTDASLLGFAYPPSNAGAENDGLCIGDRYFGNTGTAVAPYNKGRTATHEIGHYFNLIHPWGSGGGVTGSNCGVGSNSDNVTDTPSTSGFYQGCPNFPNNTKSCTSSSNGSMFMNYMDYTNDACMAFFTAGQKTRARAALNGPRASLLTSQGAIPLGLESNELAKSIEIYPNPSSDHITIRSPKVAIETMQIYNSVGQIIKTIFISDQQKSIDISGLSSGHYFIKLLTNEELIKTERFIKL